MSDAALVLSGEKRWCVEHGSCLDIMKTLPDNSIDAVVCDPPYGLGKQPDVVELMECWLRGDQYDPGGGGFMGRKWDSFVPGPHYWREAMRVLKPGGHMLVFAGTRTVDLMGLSIRMAGGQVRDSIAWCMGSGFPKSLNLKGVGCVCEEPKEIPKHKLRSLSGTNLQAAVPTETQCGKVLQPVLSQQDPSVNRNARTESEATGTKEPCLEGRSNDIQEEGELQERSVCSLPGCSDENGPQGRLCNGASVACCPEDGSSAPEDGGRSSRKPRPNRQSSKQSGIVAEQSQPQTSRAWPLCGRCNQPIIPSGIGTALKPAHEPILLVRKPLIGTVVANVLEYGTGGINIDGCRVAHASSADKAAHDAQVQAIKSRGGSMEGSWKNSSDLSGASDVSDAGRWPPNLLLTHSAECQRIGTHSVKANPTWDTPNRDTAPSAFTGAEVSKVRHATGRPGGSTNFAMTPGRPVAEEEIPIWQCADGCPVRLMDEQTGESRSTGGANNGGLRGAGYGHSGTQQGMHAGGLGDTGTASRFFPQSQWSELDDIEPFYYTPKASRSGRDIGLEQFRARSGGEATQREDDSAGTQNPRAGAGRNGGARNVHPTVKPVELMRWLVRLVTPTDGVILDPFTGSGGTGVAAVMEGFRFIGCELNDTDEEPFVSIARARITHISGGHYVPRESLRAEKPPAQVTLFERLTGS